MSDQARNDLSVLISRTASEHGHFIPLMLRYAIADALLAEGFAKPLVVNRNQILEERMSDLRQVVEWREAARRKGGRHV